MQDLLKYLAQLLSPEAGDSEINTSSASLNSCYLALHGWISRVSHFCRQLESIQLAKKEARLELMGIVEGELKGIVEECGRIEGELSGVMEGGGGDSLVET